MRSTTTWRLMAGEPATFDFIYLTSNFVNAPRGAAKNKLFGDIGSIGGMFGLF